MIDIYLHKKNSKFHRDAIHYEDERYRLQTDGIFIGLYTGKEDAIVKHILSEYQSKGEGFVKDLRGSFLVYLFDKTASKHLIYTNQTGDQRIFYFHNGQTTMVSTSIEYIAGKLKQSKIPYTLDRYAAYYMLTYGYMFNDRTLIGEVRRLKPGHYLRIGVQDFTILHYHRLSNTPDDSLSEKDALERLDTLFRNAISMEFEKDASYGLTPLCSLSGGLDSRMTTWVGHEMGYTGMTNFTFSRKDAPDMAIAQQIAKKLNHPWIFVPLDHADFMCNAEEVNRLTEGSASYLPLSHGKYAIDRVNFEEYGLLHSGQLGDVILGSYSSGKEYGEPGFIRAVSSRLVPKLPVEDLGGYSNLELMLFKNRGFNFILCGNLPVQQYTQVTSPFLDVDFLEFSFSIPLKFRVNHRIYKKWVLQKYPGAAAFKWEKLGRKITAKTIPIRGKEVPISTLPSFVIQGIKLHMRASGRSIGSGNRGMNPFQYWYDTNLEVRQFIEQYFRENIDLIRDQEIRTDCEQLFTGGNIHEKAQVLTLLSSVKLFWS